MNMIDESYAWNSVKNILNKFPHESEELLPGVKWGCYGQLYTPAFWKFQYLLSDFSNTNPHRLSDTLIEEIIMCLLGGYGIPSEMGIWAFNRLKERRLIQEGVGQKLIFDALSEPFSNDKGQEVRYRFYNQKSRYIYILLNRTDLSSIPDRNDLKLRQWLLTVDGIGLKTASWITRNWLNSNRVAILDVHVIRAGILAGFFSGEVNVSKAYLSLEKAYLNFCSALRVPASDMDAIIWIHMKKTMRLAHREVNLHQPIC